MIRNVVESAFPRHKLIVIVNNTVVICVWIRYAYTYVLSSKSYNTFAFSHYLAQDTCPPLAFSTGSCHPEMGYYILFFTWVSGAQCLPSHLVAVRYHREKWVSDLRLYKKVCYQKILKAHSVAFLSLVLFTPLHICRSTQTSWAATDHDNNNMVVKWNLSNLVTITSA